MRLLPQQTTSTFHSHAPQLSRSTRIRNPAYHKLKTWYFGSTECTSWLLKLLTSTMNQAFRKPLGKRFSWSSKEAHSGLPKYDCQTPIQKRRGIKSLDCETHAKILREKLQCLLETGELDKLSRTIKEFRRSSVHQLVSTDFQIWQLPRKFKNLNTLPRCFHSFRLQRLFGERKFH